jgi:hypothetical protein
MQATITSKSSLKAVLDVLQPPPALREVLEGMLEWDPSKRKTIDQVLEMAYCQLVKDGKVVEGGLVPEGKIRPDTVQPPGPIVLPTKWTIETEEA